MKALKQKLAGILAQAKGVRYDRVAAGIVAVVGVAAGLAPFAHLIPGQTGLVVAGLCAGAGAFLPRANKAAGILKAAYGQQTPLLKVLPELWATLINGPSIIAEAKAAELTAAAAQAKSQQEKDNATLVEQLVEKKLEEWKHLTGGFTPDQLFTPDQIAGKSPLPAGMVVSDPAEEPQTAAAGQSDGPVTIAADGPQVIAADGPQVIAAGGPVTIAAEGQAAISTTGGSQ